MPFFADKFKSPLSKKNSKKFPTDEKSSTIQLNLQGYRAEFTGGKWISDTNNLNENTASEIEQMQRTITSLKEQNNLLKLKNEILMEMLVDDAVTGPDE